ncbi:MAG: PAS domain-containing protein, partial [Candidatus Latescibacteria bacterium]|nr:PAS domain-containing protein [Candidatus Latescibacterota bacterium]
MTDQILPYFSILIASFVVSLFSAGYAWYKRSTPGAVPMVALSIAIAFWSGCAVFSLFQTELTSFVILSNIQSIAQGILPVGWVFFALQYTGRTRWLRPMVFLCLLVEPTIAEILFWSDASHGLMRTDSWIDTSGPFPIHLSNFGIGYWTHMGYSYIILMGASALLVKELIHSRHLVYRGQVPALVGAWLVPFAANILQVAKLSPVPNMIMTPLAFTVTNFLLVWGVLRYRLLEVVPIAREVVLDNIRDGVIVLNLRGHVADLNRAARAMFGRNSEEIVGEEATVALAEWTDLLASTPIQEDRTHTRELMTGDAELRQFDIRLFPLYDQRSRLAGRLIVVQDATERLRAEEERLKISKLESMGLLAGGIAHDFNNSLAGILGYLSIAKLDIEPDHPVNAQLDKVEEAADYARSLTQQLLTFSRGGQPVKELTTIGEVLRSAVSFSLSGSNVRCVWELPDDLWAVPIDTGQITQVVQNLVINADQAMPDGGVISISCENHRIEQEIDLQGIVLEP